MKFRNPQSSYYDFGIREKTDNHLDLAVLKGLNEIIETVSGDGEIIKNLALGITDESDTTKDNSSLIKHRKFKLPDGKRLYFYPNFQLRKIHA